MISFPAGAGLLGACVWRFPAPEKKGGGAILLLLLLLCALLLLQTLVLVPCCALLSPAPCPQDPRCLGRDTSTQSGIFFWFHSILAGMGLGFFFEFSA